MKTPAVYKKDVHPKLMEELGIKNPMAIPKLIKIVVNCGMGEALKDKKVLEKMSQQLAIITGQKAQVRVATRAISTFKLQAGNPIGLRVTLRGRRMYDFLTRLVSVALPRVRDFRGVPSRGFDGNGNYTLGISEQTIFPELPYSMVDKTRGFEITFVTTAKTDAHAKRLLELLGMPFEKDAGTVTKRVT
ncbi:50S ribosomal protein L5 [Candidatus Gottesmanbacteria bacterium]|nr:50S ribosomal protein L5 [Candidatus Gottesmanbacteria bacterium]